MESQSKLGIRIRQQCVIRMKKEVLLHTFCKHPSSPSRYQVPRVYLVVSSWGQSLVRVRESVLGLGWGQLMVKAKCWTVTRSSGNRVKRTTCD